ncbi:MAG: AI-2E family transporter [Ruminococcaceae bacterium]|nr:AI-2E family transporter [Oscillospiraceae bacterium]
MEVDKIIEIIKRVVKYIFWITVGSILIYWLISDPGRYALIKEKVSGITAPFVFGSVLAFILNVPMRTIENLLAKIPRLRGRRVIAVLLTFIVVLLVIALVFLLLLPQLSDTLKRLIPSLVSFFVSIGNEINQFMQNNPELMNWLAENTNFENFNWSELVQNAISILGNSLSTILAGAINAIGKLSSVVMDLVIGLVFAVYCLFHKETLARQGRKLLYAYVPEKVADNIIRVVRLTNSTFSNFLGGQCIEVVILGFMFAAAMAIFGMPYIPLISVLIAVTAFIPIVGAWVGCIVGAFLIFVANPGQAFWFIIMFLILQQVENNLIYPKVVGTSIGLSGMWVLVAVGIGGQLMGVAGMFLMIPIVSVFYTLLQEQTNYRLHLREIDPEKLSVQPPELSSKLKNKLRPKTRKGKKKKDEE